MTINFYCEEVEKPRIKFIAVRNWLRDVTHYFNKDRNVNKVNYIFCTDEYLLEMNKKYLNHDFYTDILTFDFSEGEKINGDIYISVDRVAENAVKYGTESNEIFRVIVHGMLHLLGINDKTPEEEKQMHEYEDQFMQLQSFGNCKWLIDTKEK
ncbi:MAG: rRNA maturation RNase YbeY [Bacteroidales bacterium]|nr:rRNA maturation RNase YbeY [Bacteroidales bacterium]